MTSENYLSSRIAVDKSPLELPLECAKAPCDRGPWAVRAPALDPTDEREQETELGQTGLRRVPRRYATATGRLRPLRLFLTLRVYTYWQPGLKTLLTRLFKGSLSPTISAISVYPVDLFPHPAVLGVERTESLQTAPSLTPTPGELVCS